MILVDAATISEAVVLWLGFKRAASPLRDDDAVRNAYGRDRGAVILDALRLLKRDFDSSDAYLTGSDLASMIEQASREFRERHPELSDSAVRALSWAYTFENR